MSSELLKALKENLFWMEEYVRGVSICHIEENEFEIIVEDNWLHEWKIPVVHTEEKGFRINCGGAWNMDLSPESYWAFLAVGAQCAYDNVTRRRFPQESEDHGQSQPRRIVGFRVIDVATGKPVKAHEVSVDCLEGAKCPVKEHWVMAEDGKLYLIYDDHEWEEVKQGLYRVKWIEEEQHGGIQ